MSKGIIIACSPSSACVCVCVRNTAVDCVSSRARGYVPYLYLVLCVCLCICSRSNMHEWCGWHEHRMMDNRLVHPPPPHSLHALSAAIGFSVADNVLAASTQSISQKVLPVQKQWWKAHEIQHYPKSCTNPYNNSLINYVSWWPWWLGCIHFLVIRDL